MKTIFALAVILTRAFNLAAQGISISFQTKDYSISIDSVQVTNVHAKQRLTMNGENSLILKKAKETDPADIAGKHVKAETNPVRLMELQQ